MFYKYLTVCIIACLQIKFSSSTCGYESCHPTKEGYINVHIIPHSHDDVGWTKTVDQYYENPSGFDVRSILTSSYEALLKNSNRRFIYVESAFFFKWWEEQDQVTKEKYKQLVNNGQLEFVSGAWSMNDEATTTYQAIIDQFTLGLRKLKETFGKCGQPKVGWQIDPFGHSSEMASILSQLGFDGLFLGRIDYQDKDTRMSTKTLEMVWQGSRSLGPKSQIFTSVLYNTYFAPDGFSWDMWSGLNDLDYFNIGHKWKNLVTYLDEQKRWYKTNNIILTMGGDFNYMRAERYFNNLDKLINYANHEAPGNNKYHLLYSTPSCYLKAVHAAGIKQGITWPVKTDDFFPYADSQHAYWTGYFTSRPTLKYFERLGNNFLQVSKQLSVLADLEKTQEDQINSLKESMGVLQHHDAVSGTEQEHVAMDYAKMLSNSIEKCGIAAASALRRLTHKTPIPSHHQLEFKSCLLTNISQCEFSEKSSNFVVTVYNPLSRSIDFHLRLPVTHNAYTVRDPVGHLLPTQLLPIPKQVREIPGRDSVATHELVFKASKIPAFGFRSYYVSQSDPATVQYDSIKGTSHQKQMVNVRIGRRNGLFKKIVVDGEKIRIRQQFFYYVGAKPYPYRASGAYVFRPDENKLHGLTHKAVYQLFSGDILNEVHQTFNNWLSQVVRVYRDTNFVELNWLVGPLPEDGIGREVISHFSTHLRTNKTFYTDSNCRETLKRVRNFRPSWDLKVTETISGNYYPVTSKIRIKDSEDDLEVAVLNDRSQGGSSLNDGAVELMVHRSTMYDDQLGVVEPLRERAYGRPMVVRGTHWIVAGRGEKLVEIEKDLAEKRLLPPWTFFSPTSDDYFTYRKLYNMEYSGLTLDLPNNVKILTLEPVFEVKNGYLLRLEHIFEVDEHLQFSKPVNIKLKGIFNAFDIVNVQETTLGGNQWLNENERLKFSSELDPVVPQVQAPKMENDFTVELSPMQIRTFIVTVQRKTSFK